MYIYNTYMCVHIYIYIYTHTHTNIPSLINLPPLPYPTPLGYLQERNGRSRCEEWSCGHSGERWDELRK